jgi:hypothetical protein
MQQDLSSVTQPHGAPWPAQPRFPGPQTTPEESSAADPSLADGPLAADPSLAGGPPAGDPSQAGGWPAVDPSLAGGPRAADTGLGGGPPAADPSQAGGWPAAPDLLAEGRPAHPGALDHPGEPGHPGVLDHPGEQQLGHQPPAVPPTGRAPLEAPQTGQLNPGREAAADRPAGEPGRQTDTAPQARPHRPPLEAPQLGQLNRPLEPADRQPIGDEPTGSGLPSRPAKVEMTLVTPALQAPWAVGEDESGTPSGLLSPPPARLESPVAGPAAGEDEPSGLPQRTDLP